MTRARPLLALLFLIAQLISCQQNKQVETLTANNTAHMKTVFKWQEGINAPLGYPVEVYRGGLEAADGYTSLSIGVTSGAWGAEGSGMSNSVKSIPKRIHCIWVAYAEDCMYEVDSDIDYDKMLHLFNEGFPVLRRSGIEKDTYSMIVTGFAPGGVVVIWLYGG
ncbi:DUF2931 family protein, partial [Mariniflexile ostreae]